MNLIISDIEKFLNKYTRFMTKKIYINHSMYNQFLNQYDYLYQELEKNTFLYCENAKYKKMMNIKQNKNNLIKLHNKKYLQQALKKYQCFFNSIDSQNQLDDNSRRIILCEENKMLVVYPKNIYNLIIAKIKYLLEIKKYPLNKILILTAQETDYQLLNQELEKQNLKISLENIQTYEMTFLKEQEQLLTKEKQYNLLKDYLIYHLFPNKEEFNNLYKAFSKNIYLNKDYKDYDTFNDYHNYMYKRKFLASKLSLKKFNELEIKNRKPYLRTIQNEIVKTKEEVDIANFLYLNSIPYQYNHNSDSFVIEIDQKQNLIKFIKGEKRGYNQENTYQDSTIYLYSSYIEKTTYLEQLAYELIKRCYPIELRSEEDIYNQLKETTLENYFNEFILESLIPALNYYKNHQNFENTKLTKNQITEILKINTYYQNYLKKYYLIEKEELLKRMEEKLNHSNNKYVIFIGECNITTNINSMQIIRNYKEINLIKEQIKLLYDYKKYLYNNKCLTVINTYLDECELKQLTISFLKQNLNIINERLEKLEKEISIYLYDDNNRLRINQNISKICNQIIDKIDDKNHLLIALNKTKDINLIISNSSCSKINKNTLLTSNQEKIYFEEIPKIKRKYDYILLPYLIMDNYHEPLLKDNFHHAIKMNLYTVLSQCKKSIFLLCPYSRKKELQQIIGNLKTVTIYKKI